MGGKVNYTIVGLFVVVLTALLLLSAFWLSRWVTPAQTYKPYVTYVHESVTGLNVNSPVRFNGVSAGFVTAITIDKAHPKEVKVALSVSADTPVTQDTEAIIKTQGLTGIAYVELDPQGINNELLDSTPDNPIPQIPSKGSFVGGLEARVESLSKSLTAIADNLNAILDEENQRNLKESLSALNKTLRSAQQISHDTEIASREFPAVVASIQKSADAFDKMSVSIEKTSVQVAKTMQGGELAIETFSTQVMPAAVDLLARIQTTMSNLGLLSAELRQNPAILIRGRKPNTPGPGETPLPQEPSDEKF
ncbi:MAG: transport system periplasmic substrate binding protein [Gammaproteobacteria bacterium]|jgi:phospholipid/cholesterol/gamma-HCH transport system substrate-binding protein|nr:transport system periplasmic substrate binding protein [Gammaproteobacteria bacterium]